MCGLDCGVYIIRGRGKRRSVGQTKCLRRRRQGLLNLGIVRLVVRMPGSRSEERVRVESDLSHRLTEKGRVVVNTWKGRGASKKPTTKKKDRPVARARAILNKAPNQPRAEYLVACQAAGIKRCTALYARLHRPNAADLAR